MSRVPRSESRFVFKTDASYVKQTIADLLQNKIDMSQLVITKALAKAGELSRYKVWIVA